MIYPDGIFVRSLSELKSMETNEVYVEVEDTGQPRIPSSMLLRLKADGTPKASLVAGGHKEDPRIHNDINNISSAVLKSSSFKLIFCHAIERGHQVYMIDVTTAFLNSPIEHEIYMTLPSQLSVFGVPKLVKLQKGLYGTHEAGRLWFDLLHNVLVDKMHFIQSTADLCLYFHSTKNITLGVYVDDTLCASTKVDYHWVYDTLESFFKITTTGPMTYGLGIDVHQTVEDGVLVKVKLSQETFITAMLEQYGMLKSKPVYTPAIPNTFLTPDMPNPTTQLHEHNESIISLTSFQSLVGSILWVNLQTRPDISQAVSQIGRAHV